MKNVAPMTPEFRDWTITLPFTVPVGDTEGVLTDALFEAALDRAPTDAGGMTARADTVKGKVWVVFTLSDASENFARDVAREMRLGVQEAVLSGDDACVAAA